MQTTFTTGQLADPATATSEAVIRKCVHCGFCTATCPTYVLLGDELDSPRGRIYLIKDMLENERKPTTEVVKHIDRCLSCLSCMTTCPSGVNYMHLLDHARAYIEEHYRRPRTERVIRRLLAATLPHPGRLRLALELARPFRSASRLIARSPALRPVAAMLALAPKKLASKATTAASPALNLNRRGRVVLLQGCAEPVLRPEIRGATVRLLNRVGYDVAFARDEGCCGALVHHLGREKASMEAVRRNVRTWSREIEREPLDAIVVTTSGCGTMLKDYGHILRNDPEYAQSAARVSALAKDITEVLAGSELPGARGGGLCVAYHSACSLQHGQKINDLPKRLLTAVGYVVRTPSEAHLCCGSAGTYNILQPDIADRLAIRKAANIERLKPDVIAAGNVGCAMQIGRRTELPVVHTVELLDWATGGPRPAQLSHLAS